MSYLSYQASKSSKDEVLRVVPDQVRLFLDDSLGFIMVRGEVVTNFTRDTYIKGPIELNFTMVQIYYLWKEITRGTTLLDSPIESKLQITSLSLPPPNSQGIIPSGIQRFPFEFPIPTSLAPTTYIKDRMEIQYHLNATLHLSSQQGTNGKHHLGWINLARHTKKRYDTFTYMRVVRAMESSCIAPGLEQQPHIQPHSTVFRVNDLDSPDALSRNSHGLFDNYQGLHDQQHELLALSLAGRFVGNTTQPQDMNKNEGIRYKMGIDRTSIVLGTGINIEVMLEPTSKDIIVKKILFKICERRRYTMQVPTWGSTEIKKHSEKISMVLKWARSYSVDEDQDTANPIQTRSTLVRPCKSDSRYLSCFDPPYPGYFKSDSTTPSTFEDLPSDNDTEFSKCTAYPTTAPELVNLKTLNEAVRVGEIFSGRFMMPVPDCLNLLHPSAACESIQVDHWLKLVVTIESNNGKTFDLSLETPGRILDCRLVNVDDKCQTVLPPPPSYKASDQDAFLSKKSTACSFWEQREPITLKNEWGMCMPCPCEVKQLRKMDSCASHNASEISPPLCELVPPPSYSEI